MNTMGRTKRGTLLGVVTGILIGAATLVALHRHTRQTPSVLVHRTILPEADGPLAHVCLHWTPRTDLVTAST